MLPTGFSTSHVIIILAIALIVVGPKDLPMLLRRVGQFVGRMRSMAADFRSSFEDMARQSELEDLRKEVEAMRASTAEVVHQTNSEIVEAAGFETDPIHDAFNPYSEFTTGDEPGPPAEPEPAAKPKRTRKKAETVEFDLEGKAKPKRTRKKAVTVDGDETA
jgi:sec-independent protein translocase protein TatB